MEQVILVDEADNDVGVMEKLQAHKEARLHRALSIFVFNDKGELLLQKRADGKYHSAGLWTNTCCSHPRPGETTDQAAKRRLTEEMGFNCTLKHEFSFIYRAEMGNGLTEHEYDHVYFGSYNSEPKINPDEVADWKYMSLSDISEDIKNNRKNYTAWFKLIFDRIINIRNEHLN